MADGIGHDMMARFFHAPDRDPAPGREAQWAVYQRMGTLGSIRISRHSDEPAARLACDILNAQDVEP